MSDLLEQKLLRLRQERRQRLAAGGPGAYMLTVHATGSAPIAGPVELATALPEAPDVPDLAVHAPETSVAVPAAPLATTDTLEHCIPVLESQPPHRVEERLELPLPTAAVPAAPAPPKFVPHMDAPRRQDSTSSTSSTAAFAMPARHYTWQEGSPRTRLKAMDARRLELLGREDLDLRPEWKALWQAREAVFTELANSGQCSPLDVENAKGVKPNTYQKDSSGDTCAECTLLGRVKRFGFTNPKYHCHNCGQYVCAACSTRKCRLPADTLALVRVCESCWGRLTKKKAIYSIRARRAGEESTDLVFLLSEMPACLWAFKSLSTLNLAGNDLCEIPPEVGLMTSLTILSLQDNKLTFLPFEIGGCKALTFLGLASNKLRALPVSLGVLHCLVTLDCSNNQLVAMPASCADLSHLEILLLNDNPELVALPRVEKLNRLQMLHAAGTRVSALFRNAWHVPDMLDLDMSRTPLPELPSSFDQLQSLRTLRLCGTQLQALPVIATRIEFLTELFCDDHSIGFSLPRAIGDLVRLRVLSCNNCALKTLPETLGKLQMLEKLFLNRNLLEDLPQSLGRLGALQILEVSDNNFSFPLCEIVSQGAVAIAAHLKAESQHGSTHLTRMRVLVLGDQGVGKSSLIQTLIRNRPFLTGGADPTQLNGPEIFSYEPDVSVVCPSMAGSDTINLSLDVWDLSSADNSHAFNHLFIAGKRTVFLLVVDLSLPLDVLRVRFWVHTIIQRAPGAVIRVVGSRVDRCKDGRAIRLAEDELLATLRSIFADFQSDVQHHISGLEAKMACQTEDLAHLEETRALLGRWQAILWHPAHVSFSVIKTCCETMEGVADLRVALVSAALDPNFFPSLGAPLPKPWLTLQQTVAAMRASPSFANIQPWSEFSALNERCGFAAESSSNDFKDAVLFMHEVGLVAFFNWSGLAESANFVFLRPQWLVDILKVVMFADGSVASSPTRQTKSGSSLSRPQPSRLSTSSLAGTFQSAKGRKQMADLLRGQLTPAVVAQRLQSRAAALEELLLGVELDHAATITRELVAIRAFLSRNAKPDSPVFQMLRHLRLGYLLPGTDTLCVPSSLCADVPTRAIEHWRTACQLVIGQPGDSHGKGQMAARQYVFPVLPTGLFEQTLAECGKIHENIVAWRSGFLFAFEAFKECPATVLVQIQDDPFEQTATLSVSACVGPHSLLKGTNALTMSLLPVCHIVEDLLRFVYPGALWSALGVCADCLATQCAPAGLGGIFPSVARDSCVDIHALRTDRVMLRCRLCKALCLVPLLRLQVLQGTPVTSEHMDFMVRLRGLVPGAAIRMINVAAIHHQMTVESEALGDFPSSPRFTSTISSVRKRAGTQMPAAAMSPVPESEPPEAGAAAAPVLLLGDDLQSTNDHDSAV